MGGTFSFWLFAKKDARTPISGVLATLARLGVCFSQF
jgi:hypothetical protein